MLSYITLRVAFFWNQIFIPLYPMNCIIIVCLLVVSFIIIYKQF